MDLDQEVDILMAIWSTGEATIIHSCSHHFLHYFHHYETLGG